ncbi:hypothetical protein C0J52_00147 [Blattella germanica]|nr:hypothetical protein C0J52_00147 [Blattella germanica]
MTTALIQAASSSSLPQLLILQILQLLVEWQNPGNNLSFSSSLREMTRQCPMQRSKFIQLASECGRVSLDPITSDEIISTIEQLLDTFNSSSQKTTKSFSDHYVNVNLGEALSDRNDLVLQLKKTVKDLEMKQLTQMEDRLEYEAELLSRIEEQQSQIERLRLLVEESSIEDVDTQQATLLALIKNEYSSANSVRLEAECARGTSLLAEIMKTNFMSMDDRLFGVEKEQIKMQRVLASFNFKEQDEEKLQSENDDLQDKIEQLQEDLRKSTEEAYSANEKLNKTMQELVRLKDKMEDSKAYTEGLEKKLQEQNTREYGDSDEDVRTTPSTPETLMEAVEMGNIVEARNMLYTGADPNFRDEAGWTVLHRASEKGNLEMVQLLVSYGADLYSNIDSHSGDLPIHTAVVNGRDEIMNFMLKEGVPVDARNKLGTTPMLAAIWDDYFPLVRLLVEIYNADVDAQIYNLDNRTGLHLTALYGYDEITSYLVESNANMDLRTSGNCSVHQPEHDNDYDNEQCDKMSETPLHWAARYNKWNVGKILVDHGADKTARDGAGRTPHEVARSYGHLEFANFLGEDPEDEP